MTSGYQKVACIFEKRGGDIPWSTGNGGKGLLCFELEESSYV